MFGRLVDSIHSQHASRSLHISATRLARPTFRGRGRDSGYTPARARLARIPSTSSPGTKHGDASRPVRNRAMPSSSRKHQTRERKRIMDVPNPPPSPRDSALQIPHPTFSSPPLLSGLVDQLRTLLGPRPKPTPVQSLSIGHFFTENGTVTRSNTLLAAETGSGKSLAYLLPLVQSLKQSEHQSDSNMQQLPSPRGLILVPTHELARQVKSMLSHLTHAPDTKLRSVCVSSGSPASLGHLQQVDLEPERSGEFRIEPLGRGIDVVVGTPARILDLTRTRGRHSVGPRRPGDEDSVRREVHRDIKMSLAAVDWVIVDEADVLFDPDFATWTEAIIQDVPSGALVLTTATISARLASYLAKHHPDLVHLTTPNLHRLPASLQTEHVSWDRRSGNRFPTVLRKLQDTWAAETRDYPGWRERSKVVIFCNRSKKVEELGAFLEERGVGCVCLTSESEARRRGSNRHIQSFLKPMPGKKIVESKVDDPRVLITTSLLSRGLDFSPLVRSVFIVDEPRNEVDYIHRAGRAGRAGREGKVVVFSDGPVGGIKYSVGGRRKVWGFDAA